MEENVIQIESGMTSKCWCECKKHHISEKDYIWNPSKCTCKNGKYLARLLIMFQWLRVIKL